ncbi:hypothetical protein [Paenibacillus periandrae]|uniref:hypothetical protein n=1 Tax=Paenibacillus periandrae TaxID=1761741 RepID=UPI001F08FC1A|nr:hypothetical protein [Paenibacillus periandrae]
MMKYSYFTMTGKILHHQILPSVLNVMASGSWQDERTFTMIWRFVETPFCDTVVCSFEGEKLSLVRSVNVNNGPMERPAMTGALKAN